MKSFYPVLAIVAIVVGWFWIGFEMGNMGMMKMENVVSEKETPQKVVPVIIPYEEESSVAKAMDDKQEQVQEQETSPNQLESSPVPVDTMVKKNTIVDPNLPTKIKTEVNHYESTRFNYSFDIPTNVYYSAFPPENGAVHAIGISKVDPETLADAAVKVYYYGKKVLPELAGKEKMVDPAGTYVYLLINGASFKIEALNIDHPVVQKIVETLSVR